jgi:hypothetical protein
MPALVLKDMPPEKNFPDQIGIVTGGVSICGNTGIPDFYARIDHPEISGFIRSYSSGLSGKILHILKKVVHLA